MVFALVQQKVLDAKEAKVKGYVAAGVAGTGAAVAVLVTPWIGIPVLAAGGVLGWKWFTFRIRKGLKF